MTWIDFSTTDRLKLEALPTRFQLAAAWSKYLPLEDVLKWTFWQMAGFADEIEISENRKTPIDPLGRRMTNIPEELYGETLIYALRVRNGLVFIDEQPAPVEHQDLIFRGPGLRGATLDEYLEAYLR